MDTIAPKPRVRAVMDCYASKTLAGDVAAFDIEPTLSNVYAKPFATASLP
jgi:hypothetical protein